MAGIGMGAGAGEAAAGGGMGLGGAGILAGASFLNAYMQMRAQQEAEKKKAILGAYQSQKEDLQNNANMQNNALANLMSSYRGALR